MAFKNFPDELAVRTINTGEEVHLGSINTSVDQELGAIYLTMFKHGAHAGTEQFKLNLYSDPTRTGTPISSNTISVSDITSMVSSDWMGRIRYDFARENINLNTTYEVTIQPVMYTRSANSFYFSAVLDWPVNTNLNNSPQAAAKMALWSFK